MAIDNVKGGQGQNHMHNLLSCYFSETSILKKWYSFPKYINAKIC